ncbi:uncharacterized protein LOC142625353 [Castanea sativa]|uniref:uncharacterized protein LOC142625353 n=1 Tax=Castanea sativa TaxID=21020 RepID=UPI003F64CFA9
MSKPEKDEVLFDYISVASHVVSLVLIQVDDGIQRSVYYVSKSLHEAELRYLPLENVILAKADYIGRIAKWGMILGAFDIKYMPYTSVKSQVLADLVAKFDEPYIEEEGEKQNMDGKSVRVVSLQGSLPWKVYVDSAANQRGFEVKLIMKTEGKALEIFSDSRLVVGQVEGELEARDPRMQNYLRQVRHLRSGFKSFVLQQIPRRKNTHTDSLVTLATSSAQGLPRVILVEDLCKPAKVKKDAVQVP